MFLKLINIFFTGIIFFSTFLFAKNLEYSFIPDFTNNSFFFDFFETRTSLPEYSYSFPLSSFLKFNLKEKDLNKVQAYFVNSKNFFWLKPISSLNLITRYSSKTMLFSGPDNFGQIFHKGTEFLFFEKGGVGYNDKFLLFYNLSQQFNGKEIVENNLNKLYIKLKIWNMEFEFGKDNIDFGPGQYGILLSRNASPFYLIKFQNIKPLNLFGKWNLLFLKGWLNEKRKDISNPEILAIRTVWRLPTALNFMEIGISRTTMFSGNNKPKYAIYEYPSLIIGSQENQPDSIYNNDAYAGLDFSFYIPIYKVIPKIKMFKFYFQESGTDIHAIWQVEDFGKPALPYFFFGFYERAYVSGFLISTSNNIFRLEYVNTAYSFYHHSHYYIEGYSFHGISLGYPLGRNIQKIMFNHRLFLNKKISLFYELGFYEKNAHNKMDHQKKIIAIYPFFSFGDKLRHFYAQFSLNFILKNLRFNSFFYFNTGNKTDTNILPTVTKIKNEKEFFFTTGLSLTFLF